MPLYVDGQEMKCFVDGQQMSGYVDGVKMFGATEPPQPKKKYGLVSTANCYIITDEDANSDFQVILDVVPTSSISCGLFMNKISGTEYASSIELFHAYSAMRVFWDGITPSSNVSMPMNTRYSINYDHNNFFVNDVLKLSFPEIEPAITNPAYKILIGSSTDARRWNGIIYSAKLLIGGVLKHDFIPVPAGDTQYSTTPAPSNCMWDAVTKKYFQNASYGKYEIVEDTAS